MTTEIKNNGGSLIEIKVGGIVVARVDSTGFTLGTAEPYIYVRDEKASGVSSGTFTSGAWRTRTLNTKVNDAGGVATLASNQITLTAGTYRFRARAPAYKCGSHTAKLVNVTDSIEYVGSVAFSDSAANPQTDSFVVGRFTIASAKVFEIQHQCLVTRADNGFGTPLGGGVVEVYAELELWKERV